jgi:predicted lipoprotein with Yx(FWY)xxD motif
MRSHLPVSLALLFAAGACGGGVAPASSHHVSVPPIKTATIQVGGRSETVLTTGRGLTVYLFRPEKDAKVMCVASCVNVWHPVLLPAGSSKTPDVAGLPGRLGRLERPEGGVQLTYNEWPLYTFSGDSRPGSAAGNGVADSWFAVEAIMPADADDDSDGTQPPSPAPAAAPSPPPPAAAAAPAAPAPAPAPAFNDGDSDNRGGPSDHDGNG